MRLCGHALEMAKFAITDNAKILNNRSMIKHQSFPKGQYLSPHVQVLHLQPSEMLCMSVDGSTILVDDFIIDDILDPFDADII